MIYREIHNQHDINTLQQDLETVFAWARISCIWKMKLNASKCQHLSVTKKRKPKNTRYSVEGQPIDKVSSSKYIGVTLNFTLTWSDHITAITSKAKSTIGILKRNLSPSTAAVGDRAYEVHKIHHHLVSIPFLPEVCMLQLITSSSTRHCHPFCYSQIQPRTQVYQYAFYPRIIPVWNRLPEQVVTIVNTHHQRLPGRCSLRWVSPSCKLHPDFSV